jgi:distribution and morphology protein 31
VIPETHDDDIWERIREEISDWKIPAIDKLEDMLHKPQANSKEKQQLNTTPQTSTSAGLPTKWNHEKATTNQPRHYMTRYTFAGSHREFHPPAAPEDGPPSVFMHCSVTLNDLRASVPMSTPYISYMNNALVRPIVAYMNAHRTRIPLSFEAKMDLVWNIALTLL